MDLKESIGLRIQKQRVIRGLSQEGLAEMLGISRQSVSKWELGQTIPDLDKIVLLSELWGISTDDLLLEQVPKLLEPSKNILDWGLYLVVKNFQLSVQFYEKLLNRKATILGHNRFAQFRFNGNCILSIMSESHLAGRKKEKICPEDYKFVLNFSTPDIATEFERIGSLKIGPFTEIEHRNPYYYFFNLVDPDYNLIEISGEYYEDGILR